MYLGDKVIGEAPLEEFRNANPLYSKELFAYLGKRADAFDHGSTPEFNPDFEYDIGDIIQYKGRIYRVTQKVLPQMLETPKVGSKYFQRFDADQVYTEETEKDEVILDFTEYSTFFFKIHKNLLVKIPVSESLREDGRYDLYISHVGSRSKITFDHEFEGKFIQSVKAGVEHITIIVNGDKTYLFQEIMSLGNIIGALDTYLESAGYKRFSDIKKLLK
jgi:hypothetical protein